MPWQDVTLLDVHTVLDDTVDVVAHHPIPVSFVVAKVALSIFLNSFGPSSHQSQASPTQLFFGPVAAMPVEARTFWEAAMRNSTWAG